MTRGTFGPTVCRLDSEMAAFIVSMCLSVEFRQLESAGRIVKKKKKKRQHCWTARACFMEGLFQGSYIWCPLAAPPMAPGDLQSLWRTDGSSAAIWFLPTVSIASPTPNQTCPVTSDLRLVPVHLGNDGISQTTGSQLEENFHHLNHHSHLITVQQLVSSISQVRMNGLSFVQLELCRVPGRLLEIKFPEGCSLSSVSKDPDRYPCIWWWRPFTKAKLLTPTSPHSSAVAKVSILIASFVIKSCSKCLLLTHWKISP